ncbi:MAG: DUF2220 family protein [Desulfobacterales bacterium]|nr:DUF2220 family protein [Desulfobacterales bacterium]
MSPWTKVEDLKIRLKKEWDRGRLLAAALSGEALFPLRMVLKRPTSQELFNRYEDVKNWIGGLVRHSKPEKGKGYDLEWLEVNHRQFGKNRIPLAAVFEREADALWFIGKQQEADSFRSFYPIVLESFPGARPWLEKTPLKTLDCAALWPRLQAVLKWLQAHPRPNIYIRQMEIAGVDTKFIEQHKKLLGELLDLVLPPGAIDECARGVSCFEQRYGFLSKPPQIRFRILDPSLYVHGLSDLQIPADDFSTIDLPVQRVFIAENDINGLSFPDMGKSMVVFGLGYGLDLLANAAWLCSKEIHYWGDIDTHGFAMLDQLRHYFPPAQSLLMDRTTLMDHHMLWGREEAPTSRELTRLDSAERKLYDDLRNNRLAEALRLEQERVSYTHLKAALKLLE